MSCLPYDMYCLPYDTYCLPYDITACRIQPLFLPRTLSFDSQPIAARQAASYLQLMLACASLEAPLSAVVVLCGRVSDTVRALEQHRAHASL